MNTISSALPPEKPQLAEPLLFYAIINEHGEIETDSLSALKADCRMSRGDREAGCRVAMVRLSEVEA